MVVEYAQHVVVAVVVVGDDSAVEEDVRHVVVGQPCLEVGAFLELMEGARPLVDKQDGMTDLEVAIQEVLQDKIAIDYEASGIIPPDQD